MATCKMKRKPPNLHEKLAAALLQLHPDMRELAKGKAAKQICGMFQCHHVVYVATKPNNHPTNLHMMIEAEHKERTRKIDVPAIAKGKRLEKATLAHRTVMNSCDESKTFAGDGTQLGDVSAIAKVKRVRNHHIGAKAKRGPGMIGTRRSAWRHKVSGEWERR